MAWPLILIGILLIIVGVTDKIDLFQTTLKNDLIGEGDLLSGFNPNNPSFVFWMIVVFVIAAFGSIKELKPVTDGILVLIIVVLVLSNERLIEQLRGQVGA